MSNVLISWEKGNGLGHISRILSISKRLKELNCNVILSIPREYINDKNLKLSGLRLVANDDDVPNAEAGHEVLSFASMIYFFGLGDKSYLLRAVLHYRNLIMSNQVSSVLLDYSPVVQLTCYIFGFKAVQITDGFCCAPANFPMFPGVGKTIENSNKNKQIMDILDSNIKELGRILKGIRTYNLFDYVNYTAKYYDTIPELDYYNQCTVENSLGPLTGLNQRKEIDFKDTMSGLKVFCYLRQCVPESIAILRYFKNRNIQVVCVYPDAINPLSEFDGSTVVITADFIDINKLLEQCTHVISYGATGTLSNTILKGKPQLIIISDTQKQMVASKAVEIGVAVSYDVNKPMEIQLDEFLSNQKLSQQAKIISEKYENHDFSKSFSSLINDLTT